MSKQLFIEAYQDELLEDYKRISNTFEEYIQMMRENMSHNEWYDHCQTIERARNAKSKS